MKRLSKLFRSGSTHVTNVDMSRINELMDQVDEATKEIFKSNAVELLNEPLGNVVAAVWGVPTGKSLITPTQQQIDRTIRPMIRKIEDALETEEVSGAKDCLIDQLIKRLAIMQIAFMIQRYKLSLLSRTQFKSTDTHNLAGLKVAGHA